MFEEILKELDREIDKAYRTRSADITGLLRARGIVDTLKRRQEESDEDIQERL